MQYLLVMPAAGDILVISEDRLDAMRQVLGTLDVLGRIAGERNKQTACLT